MPNRYSGQGKILNLSINPGSYPSGNAEVAVYPETPVIPDESYTQSVSVGTAERVSIQVKYNVVPTAATTIQYGSDPKLLDAITLDTLPASATDKLAVWVGDVPLNSFLRVYNTSDVQINEVRADLKIRKV